MIAEDLAPLSCAPADSEKLEQSFWWKLLKKIMIVSVNSLSQQLNPTLWNAG